MVRLRVRVRVRVGDRIRTRIRVMVKNGVRVMVRIGVMFEFYIILMFMITERFVWACENPASTMREAGMPEAICSLTSVLIAEIDASLEARVNICYHLLH